MMTTAKLGRITVTPNWKTKKKDKNIQHNSSIVVICK